MISNSNNICRQLLEATAKLIEQSYPAYTMSAATGKAIVASIKHTLLELDLLEFEAAQREAAFYDSKR